MPKSNKNEISKIEHDKTLGLKKVGAYGWDGNAAVMLKVNSSGELIPSMTNVYLDDLADVNAPTPNDNDSLTWDSATSKWVPQAITGGGTLQEAYEAGNTITTNGTDGSVVIDNTVGGQQLQIMGAANQQVFEIYDDDFGVSRIFGYTDGSMDFFPGGNANYGIYIAPQNESAAHLRLEPLSGDPASLSDGDTWFTTTRLNLRVGGVSKQVAWTSDITGTNSGTNTGDNAVNTLYSGLVTNATHTGDVTGSGALTIDPTAITGKTAVTAVGTDYVLISDTSDSGNLKKALVSDFGGGGSGDMVLATAQTVTGAKTFNDTKLLMRNVADTYNGSFTNTNTANRVYTLQDKAGTVGLVVPRIISATSYTTSTTIDASITDVYAITAQAGALLFNNPTGSPQDGQGLVIRIKDNGTARALTYGSEFRGVVGALPSTTVLSKILYMAFMYNSAETKWDLIGKSQEA